MATVENDIALIEFDSALQTTKYVRPISLPLSSLQVSDLEGQLAYVAGIYRSI